ncbi:hypothetical protein LNTAR_22869 [Lentisphaera araneosa HTCC2155]|uniref:Uncharacterized protein n=1 Tax=Lentisphaera araneosa HTCC2155 TaxID=313628 RepID=A6DGG5_9BACT|nr:hypothetical protein [Lentisphaera araneosa]EDM29282.1 hypothetical protein LNTAR_22869 [Lentisphaera araneosa HTCC2155]
MKYCLLFLLFFSTGLPALELIDQLDQSHRESLAKLSKQLQEKKVANKKKLEDLKLKLKKSFMTNGDLENTLYMDAILKGDSPKEKAPAEYTKLLESYKISVSNTEKAYKKAQKSQYLKTKKSGQEIIAAYLKKHDLEAAKKTKAYLDRLEEYPSPPKNKTVIVEQSPKNNSSPNNPPNDLEKWIVGSWKSQFSRIHTFYPNHTGIEYFPNTDRSQTFEWSLVDQGIQTKTGIIFSKIDQDHLQATGFKWAKKPVKYTRIKNAKPIIIH